MPISSALRKAAFAASTRLVIPIPIATIALSFTYTTQFDLVRLATLYAISRSDISCLLAWRVVKHFAFMISSSLTISLSWNTKPPSTCLKSYASSLRTRYLLSCVKILIRFLLSKTCKASSSTFAAIMTSTKISLIFSASALFSVPLIATTPPYAETGSHFRALT